MVWLVWRRRRCLARAAHLVGRGRSVEIGSADSLLAVANAYTPIGVTAREIQYFGDPPGGAGPVLVDPANSDDLVRFWNLRAHGVDVLPWPLGYEDVVEPIVRAWRAANRGRSMTKITGSDGSPLPPHLAVWLRSEQTALGDARLQQILQVYGLEPWHSGGPVRSWHGRHPLTTDFSHSVFRQRSRRPRGTCDDPAAAVTVAARISPRSLARHRRSRCGPVPGDRARPRTNGGNSGSCGPPALQPSGVARQGNGAVPKTER